MEVSDGLHTPVGLPQGKNPRYSLNLRLREIQRTSGRFWRRENLLPAQVLELGTVQPLASRYADYDITIACRKMYGGHKTCL